MSDGRTTPPQALGGPKPRYGRVFGPDNGARNGAFDHFRAIGMELSRGIHVYNCDLDLTASNIVKE
jgi:hypothetical protein